MRMFAENLQALKETDPACAELLESAPADAELDIACSRAGAPTATLRRGHGAPRALYSRFDPAKQAARETDRFDADAARASGAVLVLGLGLGYHLQELARRLPKAHFVVVEKRPALARAALERADWTGLLRQGRLSLLVGAAPHQAAAVAARAPGAVPFRHPALFLTDMDYYYPLLRAHTRARGQAPGLRVLSFLARGQALPYSLMDCHAAFRALGHDVRVADLRAVTRDRELLDAVYNAAVEFCPDLVFTIDAAGLIPALIRDLGVPAVSWFFDDPLGFLGSRREPTESPCLFLEDLGDQYHIFTWDRTYVAPLRDLGAAHVEHLPFAANPAVFRPITLTREQASQYACDVSFAGNSGNSDEGWYRRDMIRALAAFDVSVYGDPGWEAEARDGIRYRGHIDNRTELPLLYNASRINLNLTAKQLRTALPIRVFDVPAAGGFLIGDYRVDLIELFEDGREVVCCRDADALPDLVRHYLARPEERAAIAAAGRRRILAEHTFEHRIARILASVAPES